MTLNTTSISRLFLLFTISLTLSCAPAWAGRDVRGITFADSSQVGGQTLQLNGAGVRVKVIVDVYAAGLYLPRRESTASSILDMAGPKSMHVVLLRDLTGEDFADAMMKGFRKNNSDNDNAKFLPRLEAIRNSMMTFGHVKKGTSIHIDFVPGAGTRALIEGVQKGGDIPGEDFYAALLKIWLGNHPVDSTLKEDLLGAQ
jgi:hypothetical protein